VKLGPSDHSDEVAVKMRARPTALNSVSLTADKAILKPGKRLTCAELSELGSSIIPQFRAL